MMLIIALRFSLRLSSLAGAKHLIYIAGWSLNPKMVLVTDGDVTVFNSEGKVIESQLVPPANAFVDLRDYYVRAYLGRTPMLTPKYWLAFAVSVPPFGFSTYTVSSVKRTGARSTKSSVQTFGSSENFTVDIGHGNMKLIFSLDQSKPAYYSNSRSLVEESVEQSYSFYPGYNGTNDKAPQNAGAYIFRPNQSPTICAEHV